MKDKLLDASALINIMINNGSSALEFLDAQFVLDLTVYEVGNVLWRLVNMEKKISARQGCSLLDSFLLLVQYMEVLTISGIEKSVKELSIQKSLTFYDASYLAAAVKNSLTLVTDDKQLAEASRKSVKVLGSADL
ncbi:MAG: putative nucleic acid-binding protein [Candidatus Nitrosomirales archaeon]|jgi:predicted nucleic acid-binding protein